ncbi:MAG: PQ loop repeat protein [Candidatus Methanofastidiosum methylothiophilum]|jgi:MtN3 and saliva related transmembrane protein|uniref:PQ loop repeat protein n=1 Tax=Candidatus Methanofastidiosum methylothiophilum TaxID=1705564 RepID=A0A150JMU0_9EURY|nr:MAG: PQ loop repeat protein [Candidatus Methanofastidiosum methylthiophilus]MBP6932021.1 SemiSWEET transporter [Methanofastidiosum sp.]OQC52838.1 MAG: PQ loop repeat protein [Euryarchaeota archaeon ADurb.Bin023]KYC57699.1 MAG: PQ loop repeat protein [Candidatus Methanofastidiosum methylthiophilus]KYC58411.1 MAG: PQ loop repeat protein [Candidatus Methanofastidiosum methylthiophilus]
MDLINIIGLVAAFLTTISSLPQVIKTIKLKEARDISFWMWALLALGIFLWLIYGILKNDFPIILANGISLFLILIVLGLKIKFK